MNKWGLCAFLGEGGREGMMHCEESCDKGSTAHDGVWRRSPVWVVGLAVTPGCDWFARNICTGAVEIPL